MAAHLVVMYVKVVDAQHLCLRCGWEVKDHAIGPPAAQPVAAAAAVASGAEVVAAGPKASLALVQESPLAFLGVVAAWKNSTWCSDDTDKVQRRMEEVQGAWIRGAYRVVGKHFRVLGAAEDITRKFAYKDPPAAGDPVAFRQDRGLEVMACQRLADAFLDLAQSYARKRCIVDKVPNPVAIDPELRTDEWFAIVESKKAICRAGPGELEPAEAEFASPEKSLWWFLFMASVETTHMQARLEKAVRDWGKHYRSEHPKTFVAKAVWDVDYSAESVAARKAKSADRLALTAAVLALGKRPREPSKDPSSAVRNAPKNTQKGLTKSAKKRARAAKRKEMRASGSGGGAQASGGADEYDDEEDDQQQASSPPSGSRSLGTSSGGPGSSASRSPQGSHFSAGSSGRGSGGRGGGRGRGRGRF